LTNNVANLVRLILTFALKTGKVNCKMSDILARHVCLNEWTAGGGTWRYRRQ